MSHYADLVPAAFGMHVCFASVALALAPLQVWGRLRQRTPGLHRWSGRLYGTSVLIAAVGSLLFMPHFLGAASSALGFSVLAVLWAGTTALGVHAATRRDFCAHRRWMLRSVALTFAAVTLRVIMAPLTLSGWSVTDTYLITAWAAWMPNLLVVELYLHRQDARPTSTLQRA